MEANSLSDELYVAIPTIYRILLNPCNTVSDLRAQYLPYMEGSELSAFLIWKVQSSVPPLYGRFRAQCLLYMEGSELSAFLKGKVQSSVPSSYGRFRAQSLPSIGINVLSSLFLYSVLMNPVVADDIEWFTRKYMRVFL